MYPSEPRIHGNGTPRGVTSHGMCNTPTYRSWYCMRTRCLNPNTPYYKDYGGRGIGICARWDSFTAFLEDMGERPAGHTLGRDDNDLDYSKDNCSWATPKQQAANRRAPRKRLPEGIDRVERTRQQNKAAQDRYRERHGIDYVREQKRIASADYYERRAQ